MKCRIFLDTNIIYTDKEESLKEVFNNNIPRLSKFVKDNNLKDVSICLPELVFKERLQHKIENIKFALDSVNSYTKKLSVLGHKIKEIKHKKDYLKNLKGEALLFLKSQNVKIVSIPKIETDLLVERAIHKIKPFKSKGVGFKDTLIFLTLIDDALAIKADKYILCTNNLEDFSEEIRREFKDKTGRDLIVVPSIIELEEKLDEIFVLHLKRRERDEIIRNIIFRKIGDLMVEVNKTGEKNHFGIYPSITSMPPIRTYSSLVSGINSEEKRIVGYDFTNIQIQNIEEKTSILFKISVKIETQTRYEEEEKNNYGLLDRFTIHTYSDSLRHRAETKFFSLELECNTDTKEYTLNSIKPTFF